MEKIQSHNSLGFLFNSACLVDKTCFFKIGFRSFVFTLGVGARVCVGFGFMLLNEWIPTGTCMLVDEMLNG